MSVSDKVSVPPKMDELSNDALILLMMSMKTRYENQYKLLEKKWLALSSFCANEKNCFLITNDECSICNGDTYIVLEHGLINTNMIECNGCNAVCCFYCEEKHFITEYIDNPKPNKFWCKKCYHFNQKMKQLK